MKQPGHSDIERLVKGIILPFYHIKRDARIPEGERRFENDAEHSWSLAVLASCMAPLVDEQLNVGLVCQIATAHDLVEVFAGDTSVFAEEAVLGNKADREHRALERIRDDFKQFPWLGKMLGEYKSLASNEAKFVYALDKYITVLFDYLDEGKYLQEIQLTQVRYATSLANHRIKAQAHPAVGQYYDEIRTMLDSHPEYFHSESNFPLL
jgi:5'-deoxynucleotidase YfbR-like HD superfamily hydrolase